MKDTSNTVRAALARMLGAAWISCLLCGPAMAADTVALLKETAHQGVFGGKAVDYVAQVERTSLTIGEHGPSGDVVSYAYLATGAAAKAERPVIFFFNGGPIVPSVYLHMLAFGPQRMMVPDDLSADPRGFVVADNHDTVLDQADLVFFDPVGTGYSQPTGASKVQDFFSVDTDAHELTQFMTAWLRKHGRTASPTYLFAESYGTVRAAVAARLLTHMTPAMRLDGVFLLGQGLNIVETVQRPANIMSYVASLPTLAALGWYHGKVNHAGRSFESFMEETRRFARDEYLPALFLGEQLPAPQRLLLARRLESLTGLPAAKFDAAKLRISKMRYRAELLADRGLVLGGFDGRYTAPRALSGPQADGSESINPALFANFETYARQQLGFQSTVPFVPVAPVKSMDDWKWGAASPFGDWPYMQYLRDAMLKAPGLQLAIGTGYADTFTTSGAAEYAVAQADWPKERLSFHYYQGGHMAYTVESSHQQIMQDVRAMLAKAR